jgi:hypothetical protein
VAFLFEERREEREEIKGREQNEFLGENRKMR